MCGFCNVWLCVCMCGFCNMWVCVYVWVCVCVGFVMCVCVCGGGLVMCGCFGNMNTVI